VWRVDWRADAADLRAGLAMRRFILPILLALIALATVLFAISIPYPRAPHAAATVRYAERLLLVRLIARRDGVDDRDIVGLVAQNYASSQLVGALLATTQPRAFEWVHTDGRELPSALLGASGEPPLVPAADAPYRLGSPIVLPIVPTSDPREWMIVVLDVRHTDGGIAVITSRHRRWNGDSTEPGAARSVEAAAIEQRTFVERMQRTIEGRILPKSMWDAAVNPPCASSSDTEPG